MWSKTELDDFERKFIANRSFWHGFWIGVGYSTLGYFVLGVWA